MGNLNTEIQYRGFYKKNSRFLFDHFYERINSLVFSNNTKRLEEEIKRFIEQLINLPCSGLCICIYFSNDIKIEIIEASDILYKYDLEYCYMARLRKQKLKQIFSDEWNTCELDETSF
jgi:hypothetical protein